MLFQLGVVENKGECGSQKMRAERGATAGADQKRDKSDDVIQPLRGKRGGCLPPAKMRTDTGGGAPSQGEIKAIP